MNDERDRERLGDRLQEFLEGGDPEIRRWAEASPGSRAELERLERLDALLMDAVPEPWTVARTERVLAALRLAPAARQRSGRVLRMALSTAAAVVALALWGGPVLSAVHAAPQGLGVLAAGLRDDLVARTAALPSLPAVPLAAAAIGLLLVTLTVGARTARTLPTPERTHV